MSNRNLPTPPQPQPSPPLPQPQPPSTDQSPESETTVSTTTSTTPSPTDPPPESPKTTSPSEIGKKLRAIIADIGYGAGSSVTSLIIGYARYTSPYFAKAHVDSLPRSFYAHPVHTDRCDKPQKGEVLCFHISHAITLLHEYYRTGEKPEALDSAVQQLIKIAQVGYHGCHSEGSSSRGFVLVPS